MTVEVPAGVKLKLNLETPYNDELGSLNIPQEIFLKPGASLDLGRQVLPDNIMVGVQVTDEAGTPVEGFPVKIKEGNSWSLPYNTDAGGIAYVYIAPGRKTRIGSSYYNRKEESLIERLIEAEVAAKAPEPRVFVFKVERSFIDRVLNEKME